MPKSREMGVSETGPGRTCWKSPHVAVGMTIADPPRTDPYEPYEILAPIGESSMGEVWNARDAHLDRIFAIKRQMYE
jgi:serine/threonine protein kinase